MNKRMMYFVGAFIFAALAAFLVWDYLRRESQEVKKRAMQEVAQQREMQTNVVVAKEDIPRGAIVNEAMLENFLVRKDYLQPKAVLSPERIIGMSTLVPISKGEQMTLNKLMSAAEKKIVTSLATATPIGKRAITISLDNVAALQGMLRPGDYVDILATLPLPTQDPQGKIIAQPVVAPIFQNVLVLAVGARMGDKEQEAPPAASRERYDSMGGSDQGKPPERTPITIALTSQEASFLQFVQEQGRVRLSLRSPADSRIEPVQVANWESLLSLLVPEHLRKKVEEAAPAPEMAPRPKREIEIYRGLKKESIPVYQ